MIWCVTCFRWKSSCSWSSSSEELSARLEERVREDHQQVPEHSHSSVPWSHSRWLVHCVSRRPGITFINCIRGSKWNILHQQKPRVQSLLCSFWWGHFQKLKIVNLTIYFRLSHTLDTLLIMKLGPLTCLSQSQRMTHQAGPDCTQQERTWDCLVLELMLGEMFLTEPLLMMNSMRSWSCITIRITGMETCPANHHSCAVMSGTLIVLINDEYYYLADKF